MRQKKLNMGSRPRPTLWVALPVLAALGACNGEIEGTRAGAPGAMNASGGNGASGPLGSGGGATVPPGTDPAALLPTRIRRLTNSEYEASVADVVGNTMPVAGSFVPDARQGGFTLNDGQIVDSVLIKQLSGAATTLAAQVRAQIDTVAPCADPTTQGEACATTFIKSFATRAYRRPLGDDEVAQLVTLYHAAADDGAYADGIEEVATGVLQSAAFLYLTETGNAAAGSTVNLTSYEIASQMSYLLTGGPPNQLLLDAAASDQLSTPEQRTTAINTPFNGATLLQTAGARDRFVRIIREWLGTDQLENTAKDTTTYPNYANVKPAMVQDTTDFVVALGSMAPGTRTLAQLLGADWTSTQDQGLLTMYGATAEKTASGYFKLADRRGILNQGAFLSVYAHASETGPVLRGVALLRRVTCIGVNSPATLNITVVPLVPDPTKTTRERLTAHVTDPVCAGCHTTIDAYGLAFELYDGMGAPQTTDMGQTVDSSTTIVGSDFDGSYKDSNQLALAMATSPMVRECFARNVFRASSGRSDVGVKASEDDFVNYWLAKEANLAEPTLTDDAPPVDQKADIINTIVDYVQSPTFSIRRNQ